MFPPVTAWKWYIYQCFTFWFYNIDILSNADIGEACRAIFCILQRLNNLLFLYHYSIDTLYRYHFSSHYPDYSGWLSSHIGQSRNGFWFAIGFTLFATAVASLPSHCSIWALWTYLKCSLLSLIIDWIFLRLSWLQHSFIIWFSIFWYLICDGFLDFKLNHASSALSSG